MQEKNLVETQSRERRSAFPTTTPVETRFIASCNASCNASGDALPPLHSIYFGGGTPSILTIPQLTKIIQTLENIYKFSDDIEITLETTPQNISRENIRLWHSLGINRLSIGVQSLNNTTLSKIGRTNSKQIFQALEILSGSDIKNISIDFIIGLPYTKKGELQMQILDCITKYSFIKHISIYMLEEHYYPKDWEEISLPKESYNEEYLDIKNTLEKNRFHRYELSNFARPGYECNHNKGYWDHSEVVAFGLGAHGFENGTRYSHPENFKEYYAGTSIFYDKLDTEAIRIEKIMFGLRTNGFNENLINVQQKPKLEEFLSEKYLVKKGDLITLADRGISVMDTILGELV